MKQNKPMNQIDKLKEEFDKEFGPKTIWVVPSKENIETIKISGLGLSKTSPLKKK